MRTFHTNAQEVKDYDSLINKRNKKKSHKYLRNLRKQNGNLCLYGKSKTPKPAVKVSLQDYDDFSYGEAV